MTQPDALERTITTPHGKIPALWIHPPGARAALVLAHGAGAGMRHVFMEAIAARFATHGIATLRYEFPYIAAGSRRPDPQPGLLETVRAAVAVARDLAGDLPLIAGGKSMGGRMTTLAAAEEPLNGVRGIVLVGFPLHGAGQVPSITRAAHLEQVGIPLLFLQGTRDALADLELMRGVCGRLGSRVTLHVVEGADHSFHVPKRSGRDDTAVLDELAVSTIVWVETLALIARRRQTRQENAE